MKIYQSRLGECTPVWINQNSIDQRVDGCISGFFKLVKKFWFIRYKTGEKFHGIIEYGTNEVIIHNKTHHE